MFISHLAEREKWIELRGSSVNGRYKCHEFGTGATLVATSMAGAMLASTVISSVMAPKPPRAPDNSAFDQTANIQAKKAADTSSASTANKIKAAKAAGNGPVSQNTLLSSGTEDGLSTGTSLIG